MNNTTEELLLAIARSNEEILKNVITKPQNTLEFKTNKSNDNFQFDQPHNLNDGEYMLGLISLEVYNTVFNITEKNNIIRLTVVDINLAKLLRVEVINKTYQIHPDVDLIMIKLPPGVYELKDINLAINTILESIDESFKDVVTIESQNNTMKTVMKVQTGFIVAFDVSNSMKNIFGFKEDFYHQGTHLSEKVVSITSIDKVHLKCDCIEGSYLNGLPSSILYSFSLNVPPGYKIIEKPSTVLYKKVIVESLNTIQFYLEDDDGNEVDFNGETITFTLQLVKK